MSDSAGPQPTAATILERQDSEGALRLLIVQRRLYSRGKRWNYLRVFGIAAVAAAAPVIAGAVPAAALVAGAVAGGWIFLARTIFIGRERRWSRAGAAVQDAFDTDVLALPENDAVGRVRPEDVADVLGDDDIRATAEADRLTGWYVLDPKLPLAPAVAMAQRANAAYSARLLQRHADVWLFVISAWAVVAVIIGIAMGSLARFLAAVVLPVLPALLDARDLWTAGRTASEDRGRLADELERRVRGWPEAPIGPTQLRSWQDALFRLRRDGPLVPDFLYRRTRAANERAMVAAAEDLAQAVRSKLDHGDAT